LNSKDYAVAGLVDKNSTYSLKTDSNDGYLFSNGTDSTSTSSFVGLTETYHLVGSITDKDDTTGYGGLFVDGVSAVGITFGAGSDNSNQLLIGKDESGFFSGKIAEVVLVKGECNTEYRQLIEGYLANKYGTTSLLPSDHPYKNYAPVIQS
jgi:hypothetical protein